MAGRYLRDWTLTYVGRATDGGSPEPLWLQYAGRASKADGGRAKTRFMPEGATSLAFLSEFDARAWVESDWGRANQVRLVHRERAPKWERGGAGRRKSRAG